MENENKIAMSIAGSDPSGGAGLQADLKVFNFLGVYGITVTTCVTVQNTKKVKNLYKIPVKIIEEQIDTLLEDVKPDVVKTGMLYDEEIVKSIAKKIEQYKMKVVVDPVMVATSGDSLSRGDFINSIKKEILPKAHIITPNIEEASKIIGKEISNQDDMEKSCEDICKMGPEYVLIKGGHLEDENSYDVLFDGKKHTVFSLPRIVDKNPHGSGCTLSALITGYLALGDTTEKAVKKSKYVLWNMINRSCRIGNVLDILNYRRNTVGREFFLFPSEIYFNVLQELEAAVDKLLSLVQNEHIPEVGMNIGYALPSAKKPKEVCAIDGRIIKSGKKPLMCGFLDFGASKHITSVILTAMNFDSNIRCAMNVKYSEENIEKCKQAGFEIGSFDRKYEPNNAKSTMEWGICQVTEKMGHVPDVIYDLGGIGKEPMIRLLGKKPEDVVNKMVKMSKTL
ncbi:MAG: bifunctional hydroxymethylpyrimidine kinase/phosphomethylpyrimidine kinase [Thermoplasmatales archaeon]|nr:MAG: bifunctional hydroxymethylpyrimidine kinase/phosphomethylpyrimidine kinase [Thermoplasmatales archaeon]